MEQYGIWSLLPVALITALTIGTGEILYGILLFLVFLCRFVFAPEADDARALHCDLLLASAAIISGTIAGAHICLFGSETTLACNVAEIENVQYAKTCIPLIMVPFCLSALGYLIIGFLWG